LRQLNIKINNSSISDITLAINPIITFIINNIIINSFSKNALKDDNVFKYSNAFKNNNTLTMLKHRTLVRICFILKLLY
jgi:hypothetical protein